MAHSLSPDPDAARVAAEQALDASEQRLTAQGGALTSLMARYADSRDPFDERIRGILTVSAQTLAVERLSMWRFEPGRAALVCVDLYERAADHHQGGHRIERHDAPRYFEALDTERVVAAHDARVDPRTNEFLDPYLLPHD